MNLLRAVAAHTVTTGRRSYEVVAPSVASALSILHASIEGDVETVKEAARAWLPLRLYWELFPPRWMPWRRMPPQGAMKFVSDLLKLGATEEEKPDQPRRKREEDIDPTNAFLKTDWDATVAEVAHHFNYKPEEVLEIPWPLFMELVKNADAMRARWELSYLSAKGLPYIDSEHKRQRAMDKLQERAAYRRPKTIEEIHAEQKKTMEKLKRQMGLLQR